MPAISRRRFLKISPASAMGTGMTTERLTHIAKPKLIQNPTRMAVLLLDADKSPENLLTNWGM